MIKQIRISKPPPLKYCTNLTLNLVEFSIYKINVWFHNLQRCFMDRLAKQNEETNICVWVAGIT